MRNENEFTINQTAINTYIYTNIFTDMYRTIIQADRAALLSIFRSRTTLRITAQDPKDPNQRWAFWFLLCLSHKLKQDIVFLFNKLDDSCCVHLHSNHHHLFTSLLFFIFSISILTITVFSLPYSSHHLLHLHPHQADSCFGRLVGGVDVLKRMKLQPGAEPPNGKPC